MGFFDIDEEILVDIIGDDDESFGDFVWNGLTFAVGRLWCILSDVGWWETLFKIGRWFDTLVFWLKECAGGGRGGGGVEDTGVPS
jgi:hypothetical protein